MKKSFEKYTFEMGVTQSLMAKYMTCPAMFLHATEGWGGPNTPVMELGTQGHRCIEKKKIDFDFDRTIARADQELIKAALSAIMPAYFKRYEKEDARFSHDPEKLFDVRLDGNGFRLRGKIDDLMTNRFGKWLLETKFKSRIDENGIEKRLAIDWQSYFYAIACKQITGKYPLGVIYNVVRYPKLTGKPRDLFVKTKESIDDDPDYWFKRWEMRFEKSDLDFFECELRQKLDELSERKIFYRNQCACATGFGACQFIDACTTGSRNGLVRRELFSELK